MIKKIKEIIFNHFDLNGDGKIEWHEPLRQIIFIIIFYGGIALCFLTIHHLVQKFNKFLGF